MECGPDYLVIRTTEGKFRGIINLLKTKRNLLYIISPYRTVNTFHHCYKKTNQLMTYTAKVAVCSTIRTKHSTQSEHHVEFLNDVEFLNVKAGGT
jgi:hypothetical protein